MLGQVSPRWHSLDFALLELAVELLLHHEVFKLFDDHVDSPDTLSTSVVFLDHANGLMNFKRKL